MKSTCTCTAHYRELRCWARQWRPVEEGTSAEAPLLVVSRDLELGTMYDMEYEVWQHPSPASAHGGPFPRNGQIVGQRAWKDVTRTVWMPRGEGDVRNAADKGSSSLGDMLVRTIASLILAFYFSLLLVCSGAGPARAGVERCGAELAELRS